MAVLTPRRPLARWALVAVALLFVLWLSPLHTSRSHRGRAHPPPVDKLTDSAAAAEAIGKFTAPKQDTLEIPGAGPQDAIPLLQVDAAHLGSGSPSFASDPQSSSLSASPSKTSKKASSTSTSRASVIPRLVPDAHTIKSADDFAAHFAAIRALPDMTVAEAARSCDWPPTQEVNFQFGVDQDWVKEERPASEISERRRLWHDFLENGVIPYADVEDRFDGQGIVIVAGNEQSLKRTKVLLRMLLELGTSLPVEIHYFDDELSQSNMTDLRQLFPNITFSNLAAPDQIVNSTHLGWINYNLKTAALVNSRFAEPLLMDSDNLPALDPATLYTSTTYQTYHTLFWPDIARTRPSNPMWAITGTPCKTDEYEQESGQLLVDKRRFWYHLQLAKWWNEQPYYNIFLLGDKDMFRFAWHALRTPYGRPARWLTSVGAVHRKKDDTQFPNASTSAATPELNQGHGIYCGHSFAQHHPDSGDIAFVHGGLVKTMAPPLITHARTFGKGMFHAYKRSPVDRDWARTERVGIKWDGGTSYLAADEGVPEYVAHCTDMADVAPEDFDALLPGFEAKAERAGFYWMLEN